MIQDVPPAPMASNPGHTEQPCRFLDLPAELRCHIYEELVVVGKIFYTPDEYSLKNENRFKDWNFYEPPSLSILRVCKKTHEEAEKLYLSKNLFVLPDFFGCKTPQYHERYVPKRPLFSSAAGQLVKNVSIAYNSRLPRDHDVCHSLWTRFQKQLDPRYAFENMQPEYRMKFAHESACGDLYSYWGELKDWVLQLLQIQALNYLEIDATNAYCPFGCCRKVPTVAELIVRTAPSQTNFLSVRDDEDRDELARMIPVWYDMENGCWPGLRLESAESIVEKFSITYDDEKDFGATWRAARSANEVAGTDNP